MEQQSSQTAYIEEQRQWLIEHHEQSGMSWADIASGTGRPASTMAAFGSAKGYNNKKESGELPLAEAVERFRQSLAQRAALSSEIPDVPKHYPTKTGDALERMLGFAQQGEMVAGALEAGCGKSSAARHYKATYTNVFYIEIPKSAGAPNNLFKLILAEMGIAKHSGGTFDMSQEIVRQLRPMTRPLLIFDEAQHLMEASLEEIRHWNDKLGVGVALIGNIGVLQKLNRYAQLYSRLSLKMKQDRPQPADIEALADAWKVDNALVRAELHRICSKGGGLRNGTKAMRLARMIAGNVGEALSVDHLKEAWRELDARVAAGA